ncbi:MAG: alcohol dehydrogenase catalytic domain-containing protein [Dehalococcoidales bacterium]|nr:alcohol dehydrogenase catalytic domain-containing protein [Dehalococcoidales bacterium]
MTTCKAAVLYEYGQPLIIEEVTLDPPHPARNEVKVRVAATSICHSDIHSFRGEHGHPELPAVGGHEVTGYVDEIGEGVVYDVKPGDRVIVSLVPVGCGQCYYCVKGFPYRCEKDSPPRPRTGGFQGISAAGRYLNKNGKRLTQFGGGVAGFVEYTIVHENRLVKMPDNMPFDRAAPLACGVMTGYGAVVNLAQVKPRSSVCVVGAGGVGLSAIQGARLSGAYPVIAVDILDNKLELARDFGATHTINTKIEKDPVSAVWQIAGGRGADYVFVAVGGMDVLRQSFLMSSPGSMTVIIGHHGNDTLSAFEPTDLFGRILTGGGGNPRTRIDIPNLIEYYLTGQLKLDEYITGHYPLEKINDAIGDMLSGQGIRPVITLE